MRGRNPGRHAQLREEIAQVAARLMIEGGIRDFQLAKRKAAQQVGVSETRHMPRNDEIEAARHEHLRLFRGESHARELVALRQTALEAMRFLARFEPCLVGAVLSGSADRHTPVTLHLFTDAAEDVGLYLDERGIPSELREKRLRLSAEETRHYPVYRFMAGETPIELVVFPHRTRPHPPLSPVDGKPMRRAGIAKVEAIAAGSPGP